MAITGELADLAETTIGDATRVLVNARRHLHRRGGCGRAAEAAVAELDTILDRAGRVIAQTRTRLSGITPASATRLVSLHDPDARPIAKGRLGKPVEFGYKAQFTDNTDGIVLDYSAQRATRPTRRCWPRGSVGSRVCSARHPARSPRTAATARPRSTRRSPASGSTPW